MKKVLKIFGIIILSILCVYILFITEESIRLKNGGKQPLIILGGTCDGDKTEHMESKYMTNCKGIGYRIKREYVLDEGFSKDNKMYKRIKEEFWLFDKYLLWGWIA